MRRLPDPKFFLSDAHHERSRRRAVDEAAARARDLLVVSHKNCLDGVGSYLMHALAAPSPPPVVYGHPGDVASILDQLAEQPGDGRTVSIVDLSLDLGGVGAVVDALARLKASGWRIEWRDHHHKQWEDVPLDRLTRHLDRFVLDRDKAECGASLAQKDLLPDDGFAKSFADILRDRDLWINADPRSERYEFALRELGTERFVEHFLATRDLDAPWVQEAADACRRRTEEEIGTAIYATEFFGERKELALIYGDVPKNVTTHRIREVHGTRMEINLKPEGRFSVRSAPGTDCSHTLAQAFDGGGHPNAAGGKLDVPFWEWPSFWLRGGMSPSGRRLVKKALETIAAYDADHQRDQGTAASAPATA